MAGSEAARGLLLESDTTTPPLLLGTASSRTISPLTYGLVAGFALVGDRLRLFRWGGCSTQSWLIDVRLCC